LRKAICHPWQCAAALVMGLLSLFQSGCGVTCTQGTPLPPATSQVKSQPQEQGAE
jgi:hypothetical protein